MGRLQHFAVLHSVSARAGGTAIASLQFGRALLFLACALCFPAIRAQSALDDAGDLRARAAAARSRGDTDQAIALYTRATSADPQWLEGWWFLGNLQYGADQYAAARASLDRYIALAPNAPAALALRGLSEFETAAYDESLQDIQRALALGAANQPRNGQILLYHEALLLTRLGHFEEAIAKYTLFVGRGIVNNDVAVGLGLSGLRMPLLPRDIPPADAPLVSMTGQAAIKILTGETSAGRGAIQAVLQSFPERPFVHYFGGYLLLKTNPGEAVEEFKLELAVSPHSALAHSMLAWAAEFRGDYAEALPEAEAAVQDDPSLLMSQLVLGRALVETEDISGAIAHLNQVAQADPGNLEAHLSLAKAYSKLGRKEDARRERLASLELSSQAAGGGAIVADANR